MKTTKTILLLFTLGVMAIFRTQAQTPGFEWALQNGQSADNRGVSITTDPSGNVISTGYFSGTADFDPGPFVYNLTSHGKEDIFIQKLDAEGNLLWAVSIGDTATDKGFSVTTDGTGNIYVTGQFRYKMDVDPGTGTFYLDCHHDAVFILKLSATGNLIWARQLGSPLDFGFAYGLSIKVDNNLNVITAGWFVGRIDFDPGDGIFNLSSDGTRDAFIHKLDASGNFLWAKQINGSDVEFAYAVETDASGNVYTTGWFTGTSDFDPAKKTSFKMTSKGGYDIFIQKLNGSGNFIWAKQMGGTDSDLGYSLTIDDGYIYTTGMFYGTVDFDPGSGVHNLTAFGKSDIFIQKLDINGNFIWVNQLGGADTDCGGSVTTDAAGNVFIAGYSRGTADFNPDQEETYYLTSNGQCDIIIYNSDSDGNFLWVAQMGGSGLDYGLGIAVDGSGNIYSTGSFQNTVDFNPNGNGVFNLTSAGDCDMFIQKLNASVNNDCPVPSGLTAINISATSADLGWNAVTNAMGYNVRYRVMGTADWTVISNVGTTPGLTIYGLTAATFYEFQVQTTCVSNFSYSSVFQTLGAACIDNYEPDNSMATAALIPVNTDITALISVSGDIDWFMFNNTNTNKNIKITLTNLPANYDVAFYKSNGIQIGISQNTGTTDETIIYNTTKLGTYYVKVYGAGGAFNPNDCYTLQASIRSASWKSIETDVNDDLVATDISVYPNPASTILNINLSSPINGNITLRFTDMSGKTFRVYNFTAVEGMNQYTVNLNDFRDGLCFMRLTTGSQNYFRKIIIRK